MKLRIFSFAGDCDGSEFSKNSSHLFTFFDSNGPGDPIGGVDPATCETIADRPQYRALQTLYFAWRNLSGKLDYVGFENAARPLFIDPVPQPRYLQEFPAIARLKAQHFINWQVPVLPVSQPALRDYAAMRSAFSSADHQRIENWVAGFDIITTPICDGLNDPLRREFFKTRWPPFAEILRGARIFGQLPAEDILTSPLWPWHNSFIMKSELFEQFIGPAFEAIFEFEKRHPQLLTHGADLFMERLLGLYLQFLHFNNPLIRISDLPILHEVPEAAPRALPTGFDATKYLEFNPDVAAAGIPAVVHFLVDGYREMRRWAP
jgi:hypothetical protein